MIEVAGRGRSDLLSHLRRTLRSQQSTKQDLSRHGSHYQAELWLRNAYNRTRHLAGGAGRGGAGGGGGHRRGLPPLRLRHAVRQRARDRQRPARQDGRGRRAPGGPLRHQQAVEHVPPAGGGGGDVPALAGGAAAGLPGPVLGALARGVQGGRGAVAARRAGPHPHHVRGAGVHVARHGAPARAGAGALRRRLQLQLAAAGAPLRRRAAAAGRQPGGVPPVPDAARAARRVPRAGRDGGGVLAAGRAQRRAPRLRAGRARRPGRAARPPHQGARRQVRQVARADHPALPGAERHGGYPQVHQSHAPAREPGHLRLRAGARGAAVHRHLQLRRARLPAAGGATRCELSLPHRVKRQGARPPPSRRPLVLTRSHHAPRAGVASPARSTAHLAPTVWPLTSPLSSARATSPCEAPPTST